MMWHGGARPPAVLVCPNAGPGYAPGGVSPNGGGSLHPPDRAPI